jgi:hypothetical protein
VQPAAGFGWARLAIQAGFLGPARISRFDRIVSLARVPHFQLVTVDGNVLGARELSGPDWPPGSVIYTGPNEPNLRVVRKLDTENNDPEMHFTVLVVEPV